MHDSLVLMAEKKAITWMQKNYLYQYFMTFNGLQDGTPYSGHHICNIPEIVPLDNCINIDILHSFNFHCVLRRFFFKGKVNDEEDK